MRRFAAVSLVVLFFTFLPSHAQTASPQSVSSQRAEADRKAKIFKLWSTLSPAVTGQRESEALSIALQLLHAVPIHDAISDSIDGQGGDWDYRQQRTDALGALKTFHALDEYVRKIKAYYKEDTTNATYDELMAEVLALEDLKATTPFLEDAHKADPANTFITTELATRYEAEGRDQELYALVDPILVADTPMRGGLPVNLVALYTRMNQLPRLAQMVAASLKPALPGAQFYGNISPDEVHRIGQLLLELGLNQKLDELAALLQEPSSNGQQLNIEPMAVDIHRMQGLLSLPPQDLPGAQLPFFRRPRPLTTTTRTSPPTISIPINWWPQMKGNMAIRPSSLRPQTDSETFCLSNRANTGHLLSACVRMISVPRGFLNKLPYRKKSAP